MSAIVRESKAEGLLAEWLAPREPSRLRLFVFAALMVAWVALLIILYFTTVRPNREHTPAKAVAQSATSVGREIHATSVSARLPAWRHG